MRNILAAIKKFAVKHIDKVTHASICYGITYTLADKATIAIGVGVATLVGVGMEYWDKHRNGKFSIGDIVADVAGIILAYVIFVGV